MDILDTPNEAPKQPANGAQTQQTQTQPPVGNAGFTFDMPFVTGASNALGEEMKKFLNTEMGATLKRIAVQAKVDHISVDSLFVSGTQVGSNVDCVVLHTNSINGKVYTYNIAVSDTPPFTTPSNILAELTNNQNRMGGRPTTPLQTVRIVGQDRLLTEVVNGVRSMHGDVNVVHLELLDARQVALHDERALRHLSRNFIEVLIKELLGGSLPTTVSDVIKRYNPQTINAVPKLLVTADSAGMTIDPLGKPIRTDWTVSVSGVAAHNTTNTMINVGGYNDLVPVNTTTPQGQPVVRFAPHIVVTDVNLPSGAASDLGAVLLALSTMNTMASGPLAIAPFMRMRDSSTRDPMSMEVLTHAFEQANVNANKTIPKSVDANGYYALLMKHMTPEQVARSIDMGEHTTMATMCSVLLEAALEWGGEVGDGSKRVYDAVNQLTGGAYGSIVGDKAIPIYSEVYTLPSGYIETRGGEVLDIRTIDALSILTKKRQDNSAFHSPEIAVRTLLSDVRRNDFLGYWAAVMNVMAPQAHVTGLTYRGVFNPSFINALTKAVNTAGFMPSILPGDFVVPGMVDVGATFKTNGWVNTAVPFGGGITTPTDYTRI